MKKVILLLLLLFLLIPFLLAQRLVREGLEALRQQNYEDATKLLQNAIKAYPSNQKAYLYLYFAYMAQDKYTLAEGILLAGVEIPGPDTSELYYHLGNLMFQRGEWEFAIKYYTRSLELQENYSPSLLNRANALVEQGSSLEQTASDYKKAWEDFRLAILDYSAFLSLNTSTPKKEEINQMINLLKGKEQELLDLQKAQEVAMQQTAVNCKADSAPNGCQNSGSDCSSNGGQSLDNTVCQQDSMSTNNKSPRQEEGSLDFPQGNPQGNKEQSSLPSNSSHDHSSQTKVQDDLQGDSSFAKEKNDQKNQTGGTGAQPSSKTVDSKTKANETSSKNTPSDSTEDLEKTKSKANQKENKKEENIGKAKPAPPSANKNSTNSHQQTKDSLRQKLLNSLSNNLREETLLLREKNLLNVQEFNKEITIDE